MTEIVNVEQAAAWDGSEGDHWAEHADRYERAAWRHEARLVDPALIRDGDRIVDLGCGTGKSTRDAARLATGGSALGIDLSSRMLAEARARAAAEGIANVEFEQADAQVHRFEPGAYDLAISSFGVMFFNDPVAAFANVRTSLRDDGRLAVLVWREMRRNVWVQLFRNALAMGRELPEPPPVGPHPFGLADPDHVTGILGDAGFGDVSFMPIDEPIEFGSDTDDAFTFAKGAGIVEGLTHDLDASAKAEALDKLRAALAEHATSEGVLLPTSAWLVTARAAS